MPDHSKKLEDQAWNDPNTPSHTTPTIFLCHTFDMTSSSRKPKLAGPGHPGQQTSRASRATSNPPSVSSPAGKKGPKGEGSVSTQQVEEDSDRTLQTTEGSPSPAREESPSQDPNISSSTIRSATVEAVKGIITKSRKGKEKNSIYSRTYPI